MGITQSALILYNKLAHDGHLPGEGSSVLELGSQELHTTDRSLYINLLTRFNKNPFLVNEIQHGRPAGNFYRMLGYQYECVDIAGQDEAHAWDMNSMQCPLSLRAKYQFVTNHGTTEHLLGQLNAFRFIHDVTAENGLIFHTLPCTGQITHGFFRYSPEFFLALAHANNYRILELVLTDLNQELLPYQKDMPIPSFSYVHVVYKKKQTVTFCPPLDCIGIPLEQLYQ